MKNIKYILLLATIAVAAYGCKEFISGDSFSDKDAYVAFPNANSGNVNEADGKATITVAVSSVSNRIKGTATIVVDKEASTAVAGTNYVDPGTITLEFDGDGTFESMEKTIDIQLVQNGVFTGTTRLVFKIESVTGGVDIGPWSTYTLTISDAEHPLDAMFGTYTAEAYCIVSATSQGVTQWTWNIVGANPADDTQILISNFIDTWPETIVAQVDDIYNPTSMTIAAEQYFDGEPPYWLYLAAQSSMTFTINSSDWSMYGTHPSPGGNIGGANGGLYYPVITDDISVTKN